MTRLQPVHYSLLLNAAILAGSFALAVLMRDPIVFVAGILMQNHMVGLFGPDAPAADDDDDGSAIGFMADVR